MNARQNQLALENQALVSISARNQTNSIKSGGPNFRALRHSLENIFNVQN